MERPNHYQTAFYLSILSGVITFMLFDIVFGAIVFRAPATAFFFSYGLVIPFGLWLKSNFVRFLGAVYLLIVAGALLWPVGFSDFVSHRLPLAAVYVFLAGINLLIATILLLSRQFAAEWTKERDQQPKYKRSLRRGLLCGIIGAALIATYNDILNLASNG
jgi:hypothetical protein